MAHTLKSGEGHAHSYGRRIATSNGDHALWQMLSARGRVAKKAARPLLSACFSASRHLVS
eukprot:scaffold45727_cov28-Tisochrysis_lutea.AAC.2